MIVRELITKLGFSVDDSGMRKAEAGVDRIKKQAEYAAQALMGVGLSLAGAAWANSAIAIADSMQNISSRIGMLPQTIGDVGEAFDEVGRRASATGMAIEAYAGLYTRVGNAAKDYISTQEDLLGITDTIAKALVVGGASAQEASAVMQQFAQALASGVLQGDEFRSMAEAAPQYLDQLALAMGKPREQLKKMASDGQLTAREVIEATRKMSAYFDDNFRKMPMTVSRATTAVSNSYSMMIDRMNRESMFISELAGLIVSAFDKIEWGVNNLADALGGWDQLLKLIGIGLASVFGATAILLIKAFGATVLTVALPFIILAAKIALVILILEDLWVWFNGGDSVIGDLIGKFDKWAARARDAIATVKQAWTGFLEFMTAPFNIKNFFGGISAPPVQTTPGAAIGGINVPSVQTKPGAAIGGRPNLVNTTNVTVTVPSGTTAEQARVLNSAANKAFRETSDRKFARDAAIYAR